MTSHAPASVTGQPYSPTCSPYDKLLTAISLCQACILADESILVPEKMWGSKYMPSPILEHAVQLLIELMPDVETLDTYEGKS